MPALITPFDDRGEIDLDSHAHNVAWMADRGIEGLLVGGSTGEGPYLEPGERHVLVSATRRHFAGFVLCGIAAETVRLARRQIEEAAGGGADAALVLTPTSLVRGNDAAVALFYRSLLPSPLPLYLYSVPRWSGYRLPPKVVADAAGAGYAGMKDSGGDPEATASAVAAGGDGFVLYVGATAAITAGRRDGAHGAITASANYVPSLVKSVAEAEPGSLQAAEDQRRLAEMAAIVERHGIAGVKAAAASAGLRPGDSRLPLSALESAVVDRLIADLDGLPLG